MTIIDDYLAITLKYKKTYGEKTILLMQVGSFFEVYAIKDDKGTINGSNIKDFSLICDCAIATKSLQKFNGKTIIMAGFGISQIDKYINKLVNNNYTVVIYEQDFPGKNSTRNLSEIISPGCNFNMNNNKLSNNIVCIWLHKVTNRKNTTSNIYMGVSSIDNYTGKSTIIQFNNIYNHNSSTYDDIERQISILSPHECIIVYNFDNNLINDVIEFIGVSNIKTHIIDANDEHSSFKDLLKNAEKQIYQTNIMNHFFPNISNEIIYETFKSHDIALQSFILLLDFINNYNPSLVSHLSYPIFENHTEKLLLANHSLKQLNIIDDNRQSGKLSSLSSFLNNCLTNMGKRSFYKLLNTPSTNCEILQESYDITEYFINNKIWEYCRTNIDGIKDMDKFIRMLVLNKMNPNYIISFYNDVNNIKNIYKYLNKDKYLSSIINKKFKNIGNICNEMIDFISYNLNIDIAININNISYEKLNILPPKDLCFLNQTNFIEINDLLTNSIISNLQLISIQTYLSNLIKNIEKKKTTNINYVKIHETPKQYPILTTTKRRIELLKSIIKSNKLDLIEISYGDTQTFSFNLNDLEFKLHGNNKKDYIITSNFINKITHSMNDTRELLINKIKEYYFDFINKFITKQNQIQLISEFITWIDVLQNKSYIANKYSYCKPIIDNNKDKSFVDFKSIRHPIIEQLNHSELYITNDFEIGNNINGMLLYGTNAVGKTSFIRSIGISIIMAQSGLYVPCSSFTFKPYYKIFTRIIGNDNLFKGLSTFAVEMSELRTILNYSDKNSIVLGDELCSGTESNSAKSIFTAGIQWLYNTNTSFIFATHFHEINKYNEIIDMKDKLCLMHMTVIYDKVNDTLVYDRKLKSGPGNNMYGLEVCKSLNLPDDFLKNAYNIRNKYEKNNLLSSKSSHFNSKKIIDFCEICNNHIGTEIHHLKHQSTANDKNFIDTHHKNHVANLVNICYDCHKNIHKDTTQYKKCKTVNGKYVISPI